MIEGLSAVRSRIAQLEALTGSVAPAGGAAVALGGVAVSGGTAARAAAFAGARAGAGGELTEADVEPASVTTGTTRTTSPSPVRPSARDTAPTGADAVALARQYTGVPYRWGGTDPATGLDCSGLTQLVFRRLGVELPRVSRDQARAGTKVDSLADARPGDLVFFNSPVSHVGIYIGDGKMIDAPRRGKDVGVHDLWETPSAIRRVLPAGGTAAAAAAPAAAASGGLTGPYADLFTRAGRRHGVDPALLSAVAKAESGYRPDARSSAGARGLMQLMPGTARELGVDASAPAEAVDGAARLLARHLRTYGGRVDLALAAYNAGPGNVSKYGGIPPFEETRTYVERVTRYWEALR